MLYVYLAIALTIFDVLLHQIKASLQLYTWNHAKVRRKPLLH